VKQASSVGMALKHANKVEFRIRVRHNEISYVCDTYLHTCYNVNEIFNTILFGTILVG
jgi:hypothetical protein